MKLLGALLAVAAAAAVIPYKVEIDKENKTVKAKSLIYELTSVTDDDGEKDVNICFFPELSKEAEEETEEEAVVHPAAVVYTENGARAIGDILED